MRGLGDQLILKGVLQEDVDLAGDRVEVHLATMGR
jgi:hypothetical protein